jgi:hypothetical protein
MVIDFCVKNLVVALWKSLFEASVQKVQNGPSTQFIEVTSCVERSNAAINPLVSPLSAVRCACVLSVP